MRKIALLLGLAILGLGGWYLLRHQQDTRLIGKWRGTLYEDHVYDFRADGTFSFRGEEIVRFKPVTYDLKGRWTTRSNEILLQFPSGETQRIPIRWNEDGTWQPTNVGIGAFQRAQ